MSKHYADNNPLDEDIQAAVNQVTPSDEGDIINPHEDEVIAAPAWNSVMFPMPISANRLVLAHWAAKNVLWGMWEAGRKSVQLAQRKPWVTLATFVGAIAFCPICKYTTGLLFAGYFCFAVKKEK